MFTADKYIARNTKVPFRIIEGEAILVDAKKGEVIHLNEVGAEIWGFLDTRKKVAKVIGHICEVFDVDEKTAREDTLEFIRELTEAGLLLSSDA